MRFIHASSAMFRSKALVSILALTMLANVAAFAQETRGAILGTVRDASGGVIAGAATVAAVRAVSAAGSRTRSPRRRRLRRREQPQNIVASRSFLVDVHLLGR